MSAPRTRAALFACTLLYFAHAFAADSAPADPKGADPKEAETKENEQERDISKSPNEDVLKQATAIHSRGSGDHRAAVRSLAGAEARLADATKQLAELVAPEPPPKKPDADAGAVAKAVADAARAKAAFAKQKLKLTQARKQLREKIATAVEGVQSASGAFQAALDDLKPFALELKLRADDGTLPADKLPPELQLPILDERRKQLAAEQGKSKDKLADARKAIEGDAKAVEEAEKAAVAADAEATEATRVYAREQNRRETEKKYAGRPPEEMLAELVGLVRDGQGLKGTYELAFRQFSARAAAADSLGKELAALKPPEVKVAQITRAEDVEPAVKATEAVIAYHADRVARVEALKAALAGLAKLGTEFEGDAAVSDEHLFKLQVLSGLVAKAGLAEKLPPQATEKSLADAAARAKKLASEVRAGSDKAKTDLPALDKELSEARAAGATAAQQLASLKESQEVMLFALRFEEQLAKLGAPQVLEEFRKLRAELPTKTAAREADGTAYRKALVAATEARAELDALKDPLLRAAEEQGQAERQRILAELRKEAGLDRAAPKTEVPAAPPKADAPGTPKTEAPGRTPSASEGVTSPPPAPSALDRVAGQLGEMQQQLAARVRLQSEWAEKVEALLAALADLDAKAVAYSRTVNHARQLALQLNAAAVAIKTRVGRGELDGAAVPEGVTEALDADARKKLDAEAIAAVTLLSQTRQDGEALRKPNPTRDAIRGFAKELLDLAGRRVDLLGDLKKLAADYRMSMAERPESERKRLEQTAAERTARDAGGWDWFLALDKSKSATALAELMEMYYREVVGIESREENLLKQKKAVDELFDIAARERVAVAKVLPAVEAEVARLEELKEEEGLLARARLKPESADELLKAYQTKTGRALPRPLPVGEKDRAAATEEIAARLFARHVETEAVRRWGEALAARLATDGLTAEAGAYQDELARLNATAAANARRVEALTGNPPPEPGKIGTSEQVKLPATGGEIGHTRGELNAVRRQGVQAIGVRIGVILLAAFFLPRVVLFVMRRALGLGRVDEAGNPPMVLTAVGVFLKVIAWVVALAMILSTLGFDVTAIVAGLGIGGLAIGLAAQPVIADVIAAVIIFAERRFRIGDVVRLGTDDPARVVGLTWRSTALRNPEGLVVTVPNRRVTETTVVNLTKSGQTYDSLAVTVTTTGDVNRVLAVIKAAMDACPNLTPDHGVSVKKFVQKGGEKTAEYRFWWFLRDYDTRNATRDEVFSRVGEGLAAEDLAGTEVTLA